MVTGVQRAGEQLGLVTGELNRPVRPRELGADAVAGDGAEAARRDLLALQRLLRGYEPRQLVGLGDRAGDEGPLRDLLRREQLGGIAAAQ